MTKIIRSPAVPGNAACGRKYEPEEAARVGRMVSELLALNRDDPAAVAQFNETYRSGAPLEPHRLRDAADLVSVVFRAIAYGETEAADAARRGMTPGMQERLANAVEEVCIALKYFAASSPGAFRFDVGEGAFGVGAYDAFESFVGHLSDLDPAFEKLRSRRAYVEELLSRINGPKRDVSEEYVAAALSLDVGAFSTSKRKGESAAKATEREAKRFKMAQARTRGRPTSPEDAEVLRRSYQEATGALKAFLAGQAPPARGGKST